MCAFIDHHKPLSRNWLFGVLTVGPVVVGLILGLFVWSELEVALSIEGYKYFLASSTLPIGVMSLAFPLGGIFGLVHKSKQLSQQLLNYRIEELYSNSMDTLTSYDSVLILLYRVTNHIHLLNRWLREPAIDQEVIKRKLKHIVTSWSSFFYEPRFTVAMRTLSPSFEDIDAFMSGYERGIHEYSGNPAIIFNETPLSQLEEKMKQLEEEVKGNRQQVVDKYKEDARNLIALHGIQR